MTSSHPLTNARQMQTVILYTRLGNSNCEEANRLLMEIAYDIPLEIDVIDVTHSHNRNLKEDYSQRIPVIATPGNDLELNWPFSLEDIKAYLAKV